MKRVLLGLGSNRAFDNKTPLEILACARDELTRHLAQPSFSSVYRTKAMYVENQEDFYNMAALGFVPDASNPFDFLNLINNIEAKYGRDRSKEIRLGPRSLDIDIELFGNETINHPILQIPHPRIEERAFVLIPALEILTEPADVLIRERYLACLKNLSSSGQADGIVKLSGCQNGKGSDYGTDCSGNKTCL